METSSEVARLRATYRDYATAGFATSKWSEANPGNRANREARDTAVLEMLQKGGLFPLSDARILDVGCGTGQELAKFAAWGASPGNLFGIDLLPERIDCAQTKLPGAHFQVANAERLPFGDNFFRLVTVYTVFTSILDAAMARNVAAEIKRVLTPGGAVLWYDFRVNNPLNQRVRGLGRRQMQKLFPGFGISVQPLTLLPPLARRLGRLTTFLYCPLSRIPFLRTHLVGLLRKGD